MDFVFVGFYLSERLYHGRLAITVLLTRVILNDTKRFKGPQTPKFNLYSTHPGNYRAEYSIAIGNKIYNKFVFVVINLIFK